MIAAALIAALAAVASVHNGQPVLRSARVWYFRGRRPRALSSRKEREESERAKMGSQLDGALQRERAARWPERRLVVINEAVALEFAQERLHFLYLFRREARDVNDIMLPIG